jgi:hypothetical protein
VTKIIALSLLLISGSGFAQGNSRAAKYDYDQAKAWQLMLKDPELDRLIKKEKTYSDVFTANVITTAFASILIMTPAFNRQARLHYFLTISTTFSIYSFNRRGTYKRRAVLRYLSLRP